MIRALPIRVDADAKVAGSARYAADVELERMVHVAMVRSPIPHGAIVDIDAAAARRLSGVLGVFTAADVSPRLYGRAVADVPLLARGEVRFVGERVAAVVAETRRAAERAARLVSVDYEPLPAVTDAAAALAPDAPVVHVRPWLYRGAQATEGGGVNVAYHRKTGSLGDVARALDASAYTVECAYRTQSVHQGYLEPQVCIADYRSADEVLLWISHKAPYRLREIVGDCLGIRPTAIVVEPVLLGADFGGKGSPQDAPLCVELSRLVGMPVRSALRYADELHATNPRHPTTIRVRLGCDQDGRLTAAAVDAVLDCGAYAGFTPNATGPHSVTMLPSYRVPVFASEVVRVYTHTVPRGNMRAPGGPQGVFAVESALDELAAVAGVAPAVLRHRNLLTTGEADAQGRRWVEHRGALTLDAALAAVRPAEAPPGWLAGRGLAVYSRATATRARTSLRLTERADGGVHVQTPIVETGTGSHTALRALLADRLDVPVEAVEVQGVSTTDLPYDAGAGGSRVTAGLATIADAAGKNWRDRVAGEPLVVEVDGGTGDPVGSYVVQIAQVAVDPATGHLAVLEVLTALDVAAVVNPAAHQMQIDGGVAMGFGFACLEDLLEAEGHVGVANLDEYRMPSCADVPTLRTVLVPGARGVGTANVKNIGETTTPPVAAAIANAVFDATGVRIRELPLTAERVYRALRRP